MKCNVLNIKDPDFERFSNEVRPVDTEGMGHYHPNNSLRLHIEHHFYQLQNYPP